MKAPLITELTQNEPTPSNSSSLAPLLPTTGQPAPASDDQSAILRFRRLLADYRRAGHEHAQHLHQLIRR